MLGFHGVSRPVGADGPTVFPCESWKAGAKSETGLHVHNLILSCGVGNRLKSDFVPEPALDPKFERRKYIGEVRAHLMKRRSDRMKEFMQATHPGLLDYQ